MSHPEWSGNLLPCEPLSEETLKKAYDACVEMDQNLERRTETMAPRDERVTHPATICDSGGAGGAAVQVEGRDKGELDCATDRLDSLVMAGREVSSRLGQLADRLLGEEPVAEAGTEPGKPDSEVERLNFAITSMVEVTTSASLQIERLERL